MREHKNNRLGKIWRLAIMAAYTVLLFAAYTLYAARRGAHLLRAGAVFIAVYVLGVLLIVLIGQRRRPSALDELPKDRVVLSRIVFDGVEGISSPALMCRSDGRVFWYNGSMETLLEAAGVKKLFGRYVTELLGVSAEKIAAADDRDGYGIDRFPGRFFLAAAHEVRSSRGAFLILMTESTEYKVMMDELELVHERMSRGEPVVANILIDNLSDMMQYDNESYRPAAARVDEILREWAAGASGIIKEYERDRYLLVTERSFLDENIERKFDILDKIREVRVGAAQLPVTVSMGISAIYGSFAEKEKSSRAALELALGRGGDQVVLKADGDTQFYGGRTKASRSRSGVRSRVVAGELAGRISESSRVIIMGHKYADCDAFGSAVGLSRIAMFCGVDVNIVVDRSDSNVERFMALLDGSPAYDGVFVTPDEAMDKMDPDVLVIVTDVNNLAIAEDPELVSAAKNYIVIDHHRKYGEFPREPVLEYIEPTASSASELVTELAELILPQETLSAAEADLLLAGIMLDTKQFTRSTGTRTYAAALYLHDHGALPDALQELFKMGLDEYKMEARFRSGVVIYRQCLAITVCEGSAQSASSDKVSASKAAEALIGVRGIKAAFAIITIDNVMHISARSTGEVNVQVILERIGGGGHFDTAGAQIPDITAEEAVRSLKEAIDGYLEENPLR